jgi:hypothetical protein
VGQFDCGRMTGLNGSAGGAFIWKMNPDLSAPLTHEEFVSLRDCAKLGDLSARGLVNATTVFSDALEERMPQLAFGRFSPVLDFGQRLSPCKARRDSQLRRSIVRLCRGAQIPFDSRTIVACLLD